MLPWGDVGAVATVTVVSSFGSGAFVSLLKRGSLNSGGAWKQTMGIPRRQPPITKISKVQSNHSQLPMNEGMRLWAIYLAELTSAPLTMPMGM